MNSLQLEEHDGDKKEEDFTKEEEAIHPNI